MPVIRLSHRFGGMCISLVISDVASFIWTFRPEKCSRSFCVERSESVELSGMFSASRESVFCAVPLSAMTISGISKSAAWYSAAKWAKSPLAQISMGFPSSTKPFWTNPTLGFCANARTTIGRNTSQGALLSDGSEQMVRIPTSTRSLCIRKEMSVSKILPLTAARSLGVPRLAPASGSDRWNDHSPRFSR